MITKAREISWEEIIEESKACSRNNSQLRGTLIQQPEFKIIQGNPELSKYGEKEN